MLQQEIAEEGQARIQLALKDNNDNWEIFVRRYSTSTSKRNGTSKIVSLCDGTRMELMAPKHISRYRCIDSHKHGQELTANTLWSKNTDKIAI